MESKELKQELEQELQPEDITREDSENEDRERQEDTASIERSEEELAKVEIARLIKENSEKDDAYRRMLAEFDNYRKRSVKEKEMMQDKGAAGIIEELLPILDDFDRAFTHVPEEKDGVFSGMEMVYKKMLTTLENLGVKEIEALGKQFDHDLHSAISHEENPEFGENIISEVYQKGYMYKDKVVRHSIVKVVN